jgi:flagellar M-ring protein FliF
MEKFKAWSSKTYTSGKEKWSGLAKRTKVIALAVAGAVIVSAIVITVVLNSGTDYEVLCRTSGADEATQIQTALAAAQPPIDSRVNSNNEVLVLDTSVLDARRVISEQGLPRPGFNTDIWDTGIGMFSTDTEMKERQKHQLQNWIVTQLSTIPEVENATVILHIPQTKNYVMVENREESRASVMLTVKTGEGLSNDQIIGVHAIVKGAVPEIKEENISVTNGSGIPLIPGSGVDESEALVIRQQRLAMEAAYMEEMAHIASVQLTPMFDRIFGEGNSTVGVNAKLDWSSDKTVENTVFTPIEGLDGGILTDMVEKYAAGGTAAEGGPLGTFNNSDIAPDYPSVPDIMAGNEFYVEWLRETNYEINKRVETYVDDGLRLIERSASVVVNRATMTPAELAEWREVIANAIGADVDNVTFLATPFQPEASPPIQDGGRISDQMRNILIWIIVALGVLLIVLLVLALTTSSSRKKRQIRAVGSVAMADGMGGYLRDDSFQPPPMEQEGFDLPSLLEENETKDVVLKREIKEFSKSNPEIIAQLIRTWLREEEV